MTFYYVTNNQNSLRCLRLQTFNSILLFKCLIIFLFYFQVQHQIAQAAQQLQQLQKAQQQNTNHQHNTSIPQNAPHPQQTQTTPPNTTHNIPTSLLTPSTPSSGGLTPQHLKTPSRILEPSPEETTDLEELEQFAKTFKQRRIKLG